MREGAVAPKADMRKVGIQPGMHLVRVDVLDAKIGRPTQHMLAASGAADAAVVVGATAAAGDHHRLAEVGAHRLQDLERLDIDGIEAAATLAGELATAEMG